MLCPLLSMQLIKPDIEDEKQCFVQCQEENCAFYIKRIGGGIEVYDCAIPALALYTIRDLTQK